MRKTRTIAAGSPETGTTSGFKSRLTTWWTSADAEPANNNRSTIADHGSVGRHIRSVQANIQAPDSYVPVQDRLMAWWNGELVQGKPGHWDPALQIEIDDDLSEEYENWTEERVRVCAAVWGEGFIQPGTSTFVSAIMTGAKMDPRKTILDVSASMCGTALMFVRDSGVWIDAIEPNPSLARHARLHLASVPIGHQVKLECKGLACLEISPNRYHVAYSREALYTVKPKLHVIEQVAKGLKQDGQFLVVDYVLTAGAEDSPLVAKWFRHEPEQLHPWTLERYEEVFRQHGLTILACEDFSSTMVDEIHNAWLRMLRNLQSGETDRRDIDHIMREGLLWQSRLNALRSGDLRLLRIDVRKSPPKKRGERDKEADRPVVIETHEDLIEL